MSKNSAVKNEQYVEADGTDENDDVRKLFYLDCTFSSQSIR